MKMASYRFKYDHGFDLEQLFKVSFKRINAGNYIFPAFESNEYPEKKESIEVLGDFGPFNFKNVRLRKTDTTVTGQIQELSISNSNPALVWRKKQKEGYLTKAIPMGVTSCGEAIYPLYLPDGDDLLRQRHIPNFSTAIIREINISLGLTFIPETETGNVCYASNNEDMRDDFKQVYTAFDLLDYIYAILYASSYRKESNKKLSDDFTPIPYPHDEHLFWRLVGLGSRLRELHLLNEEYEDETGADIPIGDKNNVSRPVGISNDVWQFSIAKQSPLQEWLREKTGRKLSPQETVEYRKIVKSLTETIDVIHQIDEAIAHFGYEK